MNQMQVQSNSDFVEGRTLCGEQETSGEELYYSVENGESRVERGEEWAVFNGKKPLDLPLWCAEQKPMKRIREAMCPLAPKQQTGQRRRRRQAPANHTCRALNANHTLFALFWTSLLRAQNPSSKLTPNQRTTPLSLMMISVASCYPPGLGPKCSLPINGQRHVGGWWFRSPRAISPRKRHSAHPCSWMDG
jgi:hypothetical protein